MRLPLFPLDTVLFPGCILDLQIFEARYLDMVSSCMKQGAGFGVVAILSGKEVGGQPVNHAIVGCEARIIDFQTQANGLLGIRVQGGRRFRVQSSEVLRDHLLLGDVEWLDEWPELRLDQAHDDLQALLVALAEHPMVEALGMGDGAAGQQSLANQLAYLLPFTASEKLLLLEQADPGLRLKAIQHLLDSLQGEMLV